MLTSSRVDCAVEDETILPFDRLYSRAEIANMNPRQYREYEASLKAYRDAYSIAQTERNARKREREEGREEGLAEGRAEGEHNNQLATARRMKSDGMPIDLIAKYTNLTQEEIASM